MNFLFDENFPKTARPVLEELGHEVFDFRILGDEGAPDSEVMSMAVEKRAVILSTDRDFFSYPWAAAKVFSYRGRSGW
jgi:predicted nuclease of predicted toxin-antitoxin system